EANITDKFIGKHPYNRLRIIYTKRKDYHNAIRVCQAFKSLSKNNTLFDNHIAKLNAKIQ
ncbi:MAG: hypothetical protein AAF485_28505, partial [Chloroflexota bacterium]